jgi:hypothetical protein
METFHCERQKGRTDKITEESRKEGRKERNKETEMKEL